MASTKLTQQLKKLIASNNVIETAGRDFGSLGVGFKDHIKQNLVATPRDVLSQIAPVDRPAEKMPQSGELQPGQELSLKGDKADQPKPERRPAIAAGIDYFAETRQSSERSSNQQTQEVKYQIEKIRDELQRFVSSTDKVMQMHFADISTGQAPVTPGKYHVNFFSWMLTVIQTARQKVEDSGAWLAVAKKKGGLLQNAWKKGNTSITMSNERMVATQTG